MTDRFESLPYRGLPALRLHSPDGGTVTVLRYGAQVVSWQPAPGDERLFMSERAYFAPGKPIRGGIPVVFPQFGPRGPLPRHGFARTLDWTETERRAMDTFTTATWRLSASDATRKIWPAEFAAEVTVSVERSRLDVELHVENPGAAPFEFTTALHTYLAVPELEAIRIAGLEGTEFEDQTRGNIRSRQQTELLAFEEEVDRIYAAPKPQLVLHAPRRPLLIEQSGFRDTVVWNPWEEKCAAFADMAPGEFRRMVCVEAAQTLVPVQLAPGAEWSGRQSLSLAG